MSDAKKLVDHDRLLKAFQEMHATLAPCAPEERRRAVRMVVQMFEIPIASDPKNHGGHDDCG